MLLDLLVKGCSPGIELEVRRLTSLNSVFWASVTWRVLFFANLKESPSRKVWHKDWIWGQVDQGVATRCAESVNNMSYRMINCSQAGFGEVINDKWYMHALWLADSWYIRHRLKLALSSKLMIRSIGWNLVWQTHYLWEEPCIYDTIWHLAYATRRIWHLANILPCIYCWLKTRLPVNEHWLALVHVVNLACWQITTGRQNLMLYPSISYVGIWEAE